MRRILLSTLAALALASAVGAQERTAPQPAKPVDKERLYLGIWHEVARTANDSDKGCVAGETRFTTNDDGVLIDRESCRLGDPNTGKEKVFEGPVTFPDPANSARYHASHRVFGLFSAGSDYIVLDHDDAYGWYIAVTPSFRDLSIFTRDPQISASERDALVSRAAALGYDVTRLEYAPQPKG